jgi:putative membrane protein
MRPVMRRASSIAGAIALVLAAGTMASACNDLDVPVSVSDAGQGGDAQAIVDAGTAAEAAATANGDTATIQDSRIAQVLFTVNQGEVAESQLAARLAFTDQVKIFATSMVTEHIAVLEREMVLFDKLGLTLVDSETSRQLQTASDTLLAQMLTLRGINVDRVYVDAQVAAHAKILDLIDNELLPAATAPELGSELTTLRTAVAAHLAAARELQTLPE